MPKYEVKTFLKHDGKPYDTGDKVELTKAQAKSLIRSGAVLPSDKEEEKYVNSEPVAGTNPRATPAAQVEAEEKKIDLSDVEGTGPGGQITAADVRRAAK